MLACCSPPSGTLLALPLPLRPLHHYLPDGRKGMDPSSQKTASPTLSSRLSSSEPSHRSPVIFLPLHKAILLNISKKYSLTPSLFIYKNQLSTLLLCSIWILEQPGLYLAEIPLLSPQIPAQPQLQGRRGWRAEGVCRVAPRGMRASFSCYLVISSPGWASFSVIPSLSHTDVLQEERGRAKGRGSRKTEPQSVARLRGAEGEYLCMGLGSGSNSPRPAPPRPQGVNMLMTFEMATWDYPTE